MSAKGQGRKSTSDKLTNKTSTMINQRIDYGPKLRMIRVSKYAKGKQAKGK